MTLSSTVKHGRNILNTLDRLRKLDEAGLTAKPIKCQFARKQCSYPGHVVGNGAVQPELSKLKGVEEFPKPITKKQVRSFLGLTGYYRKFIPGYATTACPVTDLTKKGQPTKVVWSDQCKGAFTTLKSILCSKPILRGPDLAKTFMLQTDASDRGVGTVLSQKDKSGEEHPMATLAGNYYRERRSIQLLRGVWQSSSLARLFESIFREGVLKYRLIIVLWNGWTN